MRDHADPLQFYLPLAPSFVTESGVPRFSLLKYHTAKEAGGFADFDVHLAMPPETLNGVQDKLQGLAGTEDEPRLALLPVFDGSVSLMLFGQVDGGGGFVRTMRHAAKPALYGNNIAAFSVSLDAQGVSILDAALDLSTSPIGVVYRLDYLALRPAYHVRLAVKWDRVQEAPRRVSATRACSTRPRSTTPSTA